MKKAKKVLLLALCAVLLVSMTIAGTVAYLTDRTEQVKNTFTVGQVGITLHESVVDGETGKMTTGTTTVGNTGLRLIPGRKIDKDPTVTVLKDSEECYVRLIMEVTWPDAAGGLFKEQAYKEWFNFDASWEQYAAGYKQDVKYDTDGKRISVTETFEFRYKGTVAKNSAENTVLPALFTVISVPDNLTNDQIASTDGSSVSLTAHAIQAEGFADADAAWSAFDQATN